MTPDYALAVAIVGPFVGLLVCWYSVRWVIHMVWSVWS